MSCMSIVAFEACFEEVLGDARGRGLQKPQNRCRRLKLGQELVT